MFCKINEECPNGYLICCRECLNSKNCEAKCKNSPDKCKLCMGYYEGADEVSIPVVDTVIGA